MPSATVIVQSLNLEYKCIVDLQNKNSFEDNCSSIPVPNIKTLALKSLRKNEKYCALHLEKYRITFQIVANY